MAAFDDHRWLDRAKVREQAPRKEEDQALARLPKMDIGNKVENVPNPFSRCERVERSPAKSSRETIAKHTQSGATTTQKAPNPFERSRKLVHSPGGEDNEERRGQRGTIEDIGAAALGLRHTALKNTPLYASAPERLDAHTQAVRDELKAMSILQKQLEKINLVIKGSNNVHKEIKEAAANATIAFRMVKEARKSIEDQKATGNERNSNSARGVAQTSVAVQTDPHKPEPRPEWPTLGTPKRKEISPILASQRGKKSRTDKPECVSGETTPAHRMGTQTAEGVSVNEWETVRGAKRKKTTAPPEQMVPQARLGRSSRPKQERLEAVLVKCPTSSEGASTFADTLRNMRSKVDLNQVGALIAGIRKTAAGDLLVELKRGDQRGEELAQALKVALGESSAVKRLTETRTLEIRDLDDVTTNEEVREAVLKAIGEEDAASVEYKALRGAYRGTQVAVLKTPASVAVKLLEAGTLRIGWVNCRIREKQEILRCYRCHGYGHRSMTCRATVDRRNGCLSCSQPGHMARDCTNPPFCVLCSEAKAKVGSNHYPGSAKCAVYRAERQRPRRA